MGTKRWQERGLDDAAYGGEDAEAEDDAQVHSPFQVHVQVVDQAGGDEGEHGVGEDIERWAR